METLNSISSKVESSCFKGSAYTLVECINIINENEMPMK